MPGGKDIVFNSSNQIVLFMLGYALQVQELLRNSVEVFTKYASLQQH